MLRQRSLSVLLVARRGIASRGVSSSTAASPLADIPAPSPARVNAGDNRDDVLASGAVDSALFRQHNTAEMSSKQKVYSKEGYSFIEHLRTSGPGAALGGARWTLSIYVLIGSIALLYIVYYATTYTYVLTTNRAPNRNSLFFHFPCDLAIIENKLTGKRHTVEVTPAIQPRLRDGAAPGDAEGSLDGDVDEAQDGAHFVRPAPAIVERRLYINSLLHRVYVYLQKTTSLVLVDAEAELAPRRFMQRAGSVGQEERPLLGFLREDQLLPDATDATNTTAPPTGGMRWLWSHNAQSASAAPAAAESSAAKRQPTQLFVESEVRLRDAMNGYQKGHLFTYEQTVTHLVQEKLASRYHDCILSRGMAQNPGLRRVYAEEMMRNGLLSGAGVTVPELVPDAAAFADEVFDEVKRRFADDVIIYRYNVKLH